MRKAMILTVVLANLLIMITQCWEFPGQKAVFNALRPLVAYCGLWRHYKVFGPHVPLTNAALAAVITYDDGSQTVWHNQILDQHSDLEHMRQMRFRKFFHDQLLVFHNRSISCDAARYLARLHQQPERTPRKVQLIEQWASIPAPAQGLGMPLPPLTHKHVIFDYLVRKEDLT